VEYRDLGGTGLRTSVIGFGTWPIGGTHISGGYGVVDEEDGIRALNRALDLGVTCVDTAPAYGLGRAEELVGQALGTRRAEVVLISKCGVPYDDEHGWGRNSTHDYVVQSVDESLKRLRTDYLDVLLIHWPDPNTPYEVPIRTLNELRDAGKIRYQGVSNFSVAQIQECLQYGPVHVVQTGYNVFDHRSEAALFAFCTENGIGVMAYGSLCYGLLSGTFTPQTSFAESDWRSSGSAFGLPLFKASNFVRNLAMVEELRELAGEHDMLVPQLALAWVLANAHVGVALVGARTVTEIDEDVRAAGWQLTAADLAKVEALYRETKEGWTA
jgi:myo-inositol catabolism protein IolS